ncbi:MAG: UDP-N-acetylglucosamine diphosphorylase [Verrucomicrobiales bacterium]|nr:UDP-N-acetylglucosamine diphosphorylase [Verrucomicrobiales bacterium]
MDFPAEAYLDFEQTDHRDLFRPDEPVWSALSHIKGYLAGLLDSVEGDLIRGTVDPRAVVGEQVYLAPGATVEANAIIKGPAWIGEGTTVRSGAYLRENVIVGKGCTLGNSSEFKNCLLFNDCEVPHFNYVGDSILGHKAHLGAGVICSNVRLDRANVRVKDDANGFLDTGLRKFGAIVGDRTEVGCNSVLSPGSILGRECIVYPLTSWSGVLNDRQIVKTKQPSEVVTRH